MKFLQTVHSFVMPTLALLVIVVSGGCGSDDKKSEGSGLKAALEGEVVKNESSGAIDLNLGESPKGKIADVVIQLLRYDDCRDVKVIVIYKNDNGKHKGWSKSRSRPTFSNEDNKCEASQILKVFSYENGKSIIWEDIPHGTYRVIVTLLDDEGNALESGSGKAKVSNGRTVTADIRLTPVKSESDGSLKINVHRDEE